MITCGAARRARRDARRDRRRTRAAGVGLKASGLADLAGIGPQTAAKFADLGIVTPAGLLAHIPRACTATGARRNRSRRCARATAKHSYSATCVRCANATHACRRSPSIWSTKAARSPRPGSAAAISSTFSAGDRLVCVGRVTRRGLLLGLNVTAHKKLREGDVYAGEIVPIYSATKDLPTRVIRTAIAKNLERLIAERVDALPPAVARSTTSPLAPMRGAASTRRASSRISTVAAAASCSKNSSA